ncbi:MAG: type III pantothenate kinase [Bacteroidia bacterium]|jgi:type III pantothenate kinase
MDTVTYTLVVDAGNTNVKAAIFKEMELVHEMKLQQVEELNDLFSRYSITYALIARVGAMLEGIESVLEKHCTWYKLSAELALPFTIGYETPATLGTDRLAGVAGALHFFPDQHCLVIDAGTCITYDCIDANRHYQGGAISPGLQMRFKALNTFTHKLPEVELSGIPEFIGNSTESSIQSGVFYGMVHEINGTIARYEEQFNRLQVLLCGGDSLLFGKHVKNNIFAAPNLVLFGLNKILLFHAQV